MFIPREIIANDLERVKGDGTLAVFSALSRDDFTAPPQPEESSQMVVLL